MDKHKVADDIQLETMMDVDENSSNDITSIINDLCQKIDEKALSYSESESSLNHPLDEHDSFEEMKTEKVLMKKDSIKEIDHDSNGEMKIEVSIKDDAIKEIGNDSCEEIKVEEVLMKEDAIKEIDNDSCENDLMKSDHLTKNQLSTNENNESLLSADDESKIHTAEKEHDSAVADLNIRTKEELSCVEKLDTTTDDKCNLNVETELHNSSVCESSTDKEKLEANSVGNEHETDIMEIDKSDDLKKNHLSLDNITLKSDFGSRKRSHSDDDDEEEEIMSAAKKCFQALCESSEVIEDNDLSLSPKPTPNDSNNLSEFSVISPKTTISIPVSTENSSDSLPQSNVDSSQKEIPSKQEFSSATKEDIDCNKFLTPEVEDESSNSAESKLKESCTNSKSDDLSLKRSPTPVIGLSDSQISPEDDDIEILSSENLDKSNCEVSVSDNLCNNEVENDDVGNENSKLIVKRSEDNCIESDVSEKLIDEHCVEASEEHTNNTEISVVWEGNDNCKEKQVIGNDKECKSEITAKEDVIEMSEKDSGVKIDSEVDESHAISSDILNNKDCIIKETPENNDENCIMEEISDTTNPAEKIPETHDNGEMIMNNHDVCESNQINSEKLCNGEDINEDLKDIEADDVLGTASGSHDNDSYVATVKPEIKNENEVTASTSGHSSHVKSEILLNKDENDDNSLMEIDHCKNEILDNFNISSDDLVIDFKAGTFTIPIDTFFSLFDRPRFEKENLDTNLITQAEAAELRALLEEERERGKQVRVALRAVYSQQRALYRACGHVPKVDTRTVGVMTRISDDSDSSQDNICDMQTSASSSTTSTSGAANSAADAKPKNTFTINTNSEINCTPLTSTTSSILNKALNNISISPVVSNSESFKKPKLVIQQSQASNNKHIGSPQVTLSKDKPVIKNSSETASKSNENTTPQIIDLTDDDDPIPPPSLQSKKEIPQSKETPRQMQAAVNSNNPKPVYLPSSVQIIPSQSNNNIPGSNNNVQIIRSTTSASTGLTYFVSQQPSALFPVRPPFNSQTPGGLSNNMVIFRPVGVNIQNSQGGMQKTVQQYGIRTGPQSIPRPMVRPALVQQQAASKNFGSGQITLTPRFAQHPAPLPQPPTYPANKNLKALPPKPSLKMNRTSSGISLSWNMTIHNSNADISAYQLYAYQEGSGRVDSSLWKKVSDIKAMPLPMACTLTQFVEGHKYHFAMRAIDVHRRVGPFSDPITVHHRPSKGVNK